MIKSAISKVVGGGHLSEAEMIQVMEAIMGGEATQAQVAAFITALRMKGETIDEIVGAAKVMRAKATRVEVNPEGGVLVDTCGTGGDASGTFNVSTTAAFVVAATGVPVAKHGNRSVSSKCGSADVLEALGVDLSLDAGQIAECIRSAGIGFMFAPALHGAMKHAIGPRREIGIRTVFNVLGPLTNPAGANVQVMGVFDPSLTEPLATVLGRLGSRRALVVCGEGNLDEITITGATRVSEWHEGAVTTYTVHPSQFGMATATLADIQGSATPAEAAGQLRSVLTGAAGPCLDMVLLNAGAAIMAAGKAADLGSGVELARQAVASGAALARVDALVDCCKRVKQA
ncbi:MAG: anthranilate phosphoribosyltransferase [Thermodesulfobacteriota bacterium]